MRKRWAGILVVISFLALLGFTIFYASKPKNENINNVIFENPKGNISSVEMTVDKTYQIKKVGDSYKVLIPEEVPALKNVADGIFDSASKIEYMTIVEENPQNIEQFGFLKPQALVKITLNDGSSKLFTIGNKTPIEDGYYLRYQEKNIIYKISETTANKFIQNLDNVIEKKIVDFDPQNLNKVVLNYLNQQYVAQNVNGAWRFNDRELNKDKLTTVFNDVRSFVVDGIAQKEEYGNVNEKPIINLNLFLVDGSTRNIYVIKRDDDNYNIIKDGISIQYALSRVNFDKYQNTMITDINELLK